MSLNGIALVTGAGSGIGQALALLYARDGVTGITIADIDDAGLRTTAQKINKINTSLKVLELKVDVSNEAEVKDMVAKTVAQFGALHYAANVAGIALTFQPASEVPLANFDKIQAINQRGLFLCMQAELKAMLKQERRPSPYNAKASERGSIVNVASMAGLFAIPRGALAYTTSKHAVIGLTKAAACDHGKDGIRVNAVCPGYTETPIIGLNEGTLTNVGASKAELQAIHQKKLEVMGKCAPMGRMASPEEVGEVCAFLSSSKASFVSGAAYTVDGGMGASTGIIW